MLPALAVGQRYHTEVSQALSDGRVVLRFGGVRVVARTEARVSIGAIVEVEVMRLIPEVVLKVIGKEIPSS